MKGVFLKEGEQVERGRPRDRRRAARPAGGRAAVRRRPRSSAKVTVARLQPQDPRGGQEVRRWSTSRATAASRRRSSSPPTTCRTPRTPTSSSTSAADVFGRGDAFVQKITGRVDRPLQRIREFRNRPKPGDRRHRRSALDRRGHPRPGVHRLPAAGEVPHPLRADARPRHAQGRAVSRTSPTSPSSTASTARCSSTSATRPASPPSRPRSRRGRSPRSSRTSGRTGTATTTSAASSSGSSASTRRWRARPASCSPPSSPTATSAASPRSLPAALPSDFAGDDEAPARPGLPGPARRTTRGRRGRSSSPIETQDTVTLRVARPRRRRARSTSPRTTSRPSPGSCGRTPTQIEAIRILLDRPKDWSTERSQRAAAEARRSAASASPTRTSRRRTRLRYHKALVDIISMVKHAADEQEPLLHRRGARRAGASSGSPPAGRSRRSSSSGSTASASTWSRTSRSTGRTSTTSRSSAARAAGAARTGSSTASLTDLLQQLNEAIAA